MTLTVKLYRKGPIKRRKNGSRHGSIEYAVRSDDVDQDQDAIADHASIPTQHVSTHPDNSYMVCREVVTEEWDGSSRLWIVTAEFDSEIDDTNADATAAAIKGGLTSYTEDRPTFWDAFANPLMNAAGDYYEGLTKRYRLRRYNVTANFLTVPDAIFDLAGTLNAAAVTIHGRSFPAGTALMGEVQMPDTPSIDASDQLFWPVSYDITIDVDGWVVVLPNRGFNCYEYQTRTTTDDPWETVGFDAYDAEGTANLKRRIKVRCLDDADGEMPSNLWLNPNGEKILADLTPISTTGTISSGSTTMTASGLTSEDIGKFVVIDGAGYGGRKLRAKITNVSGTTITLDQTARTSVTSQAVKAGGVYANTFVLDDLADWTGLPLPNNHA